MIPLFKTHYSIGKSILTAESILNIAKDNNLKEVVVVEDSFYGFRSLNKTFKEENIKFIFGIRLPVVQNHNDSESRPSKLIFFAKNNNGVKKIKKLYTDAFTSDYKSVSISDYDIDFFKDVKVSVPFYDSYIYENLFHFGMSSIDLSSIDHSFFVEDNDHPFDFQIKRAIEGLSENTLKVKSIYYEKKEDFHAFQMYKSVCSRKQGRPPTFSNPNINHFCSEEFCWESYLESN
jgi:DNA polymerase III alpha subunit